jgi:hypothetical protein
VYRFLITAFIVAYSFISWSRKLAHLIVSFAGGEPAGELIVEGGLKRAESAWTRAGNREPMLGVRELFSAALAYCEGRQRPERVASLLGMAAQMQDRNPASSTYGNFR